MKKLVCASCPNSCLMCFDIKTKEIKGNNCPRGKNFFLEEISDPKRVVTTTVKNLKENKARVSVKTTKPISKILVFDCIHEIKKIKLKCSVKTGDIIIKNVLNTGADVVVTGNFNMKMAVLKPGKRTKNYYTG